MLPPAEKLTPSPEVIEPDVVVPLTKREQGELAKLEQVIESEAAKALTSFQKIAAASFQIKEKKLYRQHGTFEDYFQKKFGWVRAHAYRIVTAGAMLERMSPQGDTGSIRDKFSSEAHFRPLSAFRDQPKKQGEVIALLKKWSDMPGSQSEMSPATVRAAVVVVDPPEPPPAEQTTSNKKAQQLLDLIVAAESQLPNNFSAAGKKIFKKLRSDAEKVVVPRTTGIGWTLETWNPLQGCTRASRGCDNCYAAKFMATRGMHRYPGLAEKKGDHYLFTGKIVLEHHRLSEPLENKTGTMYFVNSMSDLFHKDVPEEFIDQVFDIMESASWHTFQVLTKRPERMAEYSRARYKSDEEAPRNIWLGTSTEDQSTYDTRIKALAKTRARVRWISAEPLLGEIKLGETDALDWVVVGGESGWKLKLESKASGGKKGEAVDDRRMKKEWAMSLRDECKKKGIAFFFKQWGSYGEDGKPAKKAKLSDEEKELGLVHRSAKLAGKAHEEYPEAR